MGRMGCGETQHPTKEAARSWHLIWPLLFPALRWHPREPSDAQGPSSSQLLCASAFLASSPFLAHLLGWIWETGTIEDGGGEEKARGAEARGCLGMGQASGLPGCATHMLPGLGQVI